VNAIDGQAQAVGLNPSADLDDQNGRVQCEGDRERLAPIAMRALYLASEPLV